MERDQRTLRPLFKLKDCITLFRYVLAKYHYETEELTPADQFISNYTYVALEDYAKKDHQWFNNHLSLLSKLKQELYYLNHEFKYRTHKNKPEVSCYFPKEQKSLQLSPRAFLGLKSDPRFQRVYRLAIGLKSDLRKFSPAPYIGVGYKDKGTRRIPSEDGSPTWQELASKNIGYNPILTEGESVAKVIANQIFSPYSASPEEFQKLEKLIVEHRALCLKDKSLSLNLIRRINTESRHGNRARYYRGNGPDKPRATGHTYS